MMDRIPIFMTAALALCACAAEDDRCAPDAEACSLAHEFPPLTLGPGAEDDGICVSWTLENDTDLWVNTVESHNDGFVHHSNWFYVPDFRYDVPDGVWRCSEHDFNELANAVLGGVLHAQSTQARTELQAFAPGAAIRVPAHSRVVASVHLLNATDRDVATELRLRLDAIRPAEVTAELQPFELVYLDLALPPGEKSAFRADCDVAAPYQQQLESPFDARIHHLMPHYHALGDMFDVRVLGGSRDGESLYSSEGDTYGEPLGRSFDPPIDLAAAGARGLSFTCGFDNPTAEVVGWGVGDQEMCILFGFAESRARYRGTVQATERVEPGPRVEHAGACDVIVQTTERGAD